MCRRILLCSVGLLPVWSVGAQAQAARDSAAGRAPGGLCYRAQPKPGCSAFVLTNFGTYVVLGKDDRGSIRPVADWGFMVNVGARDAVGASVFASLDNGGSLGLGPALRYRRWMGRSESVEVAVGAPLVTDYYRMRIGSVFGLVKWSPNHWFAVAARPELIRRPDPYSSEVQSRVRLSLGVETGWVPGAVLTPAAVLFAFIAAIAAGGGN